MSAPGNGMVPPGDEPLGPNDEGRNYDAELLRMEARTNVIPALGHRISLLRGEKKGVDFNVFSVPVIQLLVDEFDEGDGDSSYMVRAVGLGGYHSDMDGFALEWPDGQVHEGRTIYPSRELWAAARRKADEKRSKRPGEDLV